MGTSTEELIQPTNRPLRVKADVPAKGETVEKRLFREKGPAPLGQMRRGYVIRQGDDIIQYPDTIGLNRKTARNYLHMFDNREEIQAYFDFPADPPFPSLEDQVRDSRKAARELSEKLDNEDRARGISKGGSPSSPDLAVIVAAAIAEAVRPLIAQNKSMLEKIEMLEGMVLEGSQVEEDPTTNEPGQ